MNLREALHVVADAIADRLETASALQVEPPKAKPAKPKPAKVEPVEAPTAPEPELTLEQVRKTLADLARADRAADVREALSDLGAAKLSEVAAKDYPKLLEALGA